MLMDRIQEDSWVPPPSYRKHLTGSALMNSYRRASMRLSRRSNEAVVTCSESKLDKMMENSTQGLVVKSRAEPPSTDCFPQHDDLIGTVVAWVYICSVLSLTHIHTHIYHLWYHFVSLERSLSVSSVLLFLLAFLMMSISINFL